MQSDISNSTTEVTAPCYRPPGSLVNKWIMLGMVSIVLCGVWAYARFGGDTILAPTPYSKPIIDTSTTTEKFIATPGVNSLRIHVRSGPGTQYQILESVPRGTPLTGIGRIKDSNGALWIILDKRRGYVKESVLSPFNRSAP